MGLHELFEKHEKEYLKFKSIKNPRHPVPDMCAFLLLCELDPQGTQHYIIGCAEHDEVWLSANPEVIERAATEDQIIELLRCGVLWDEGVESFRMNV